MTSLWGIYKKEDKIRANQSLLMIFNPFIAGISFNQIKDALNVYYKEIDKNLDLTLLINWKEVIKNLEVLERKTNRVNLCQWVYCQ